MINCQIFDFVTHKYGQELLVDVAWIKDMPSYERTSTPYMLTFYDVLLFTSGTGWFWLDNEKIRIEPGTIVFTSPHQVRRSFVNELEGISFFFPSDFLLGFFSDELFLQRLRYFHSNNEHLFVRLNKPAKIHLLEEFKSMQHEIRNLQSDSAHLLRAMAYSILIKLNRLYTAHYGQQVENPKNEIISRFRLLLEQRFRSLHSVSGFASELCVSPSHLNHLCKKHMNCTAATLIETRVISEASRMLTHGHEDIASIGYALGFTDPAYFSRKFKRAKSLSPREYRIRQQRKLFVN